MANYAPLQTRSVLTRIDFPGTPGICKASRGYGAPAVEFMTDFHKIPPISVASATTIDVALTRMISVGVRFLFVVDADSVPLGSITSYDIQGSKPLQYLQSRDCRIGACSRLEVEVADIMTPVEKWRVLSHGELKRATIGDIVHMLKTFDQRHIIVTESATGGSDQIVRGLVSATDLERALAVSIESVGRVESFAEIAHTISRR